HLHPAVGREPRTGDNLGYPVDGDADEQVERRGTAAFQPRLLPVRVELHDVLVGDVLDAAFGERVEEVPGNLLRDRHGRALGADDANLDSVPDSPFDETIVEQEGAFERCGWALERMAQDPDEHLPGVEIRQ